MLPINVSLLNLRLVRVRNSHVEVAFLRRISAPRRYARRLSEGRWQETGGTSNLFYFTVGARHCRALQVPTLLKHYVGNHLNRFSRCCLQYCQDFTQIVQAILNWRNTDNFAIDLQEFPAIACCHCTINHVTLVEYLGGNHCGKALP